MVNENGPNIADSAKKVTFVTLVLDETGSMYDIKDDVIGGYNAYVKTLRESGEDYLFTLIKFDSNHHDVVHRGVKISEVPDLTNETYRPGACTPLIDVCVKAIKATEEKVAELEHTGIVLPADTDPKDMTYDALKVQVALVIQTDGLENASTEYKNEDLVRLIKEKTEAGWLILFLGAGIDAFSQATAISIDPKYTLSGTRDTVVAACAAAGTQVDAYAKSGVPDSAAWTVEQRMSTGGSIPPGSGATQPIVAPDTPATTTPATTAKADHIEEKKPSPIVDEIRI